MLVLRRWFYRTEDETGDLKWESESKPKSEQELNHGVLGWGQNMRTYVKAGSDKLIK